MAAGRVVKVKRETLEACMTCPLCHKLLKEATTVSLCLHTFCRKCIYEKLSDEESDCCPVCEIDLGCLPVEKLRPDNNLQDIRAKIFPLKRGKVVAAPESPSVSLPAKRKERSLSALVVSTPKVSAQAGLSGKRSRALTRKAAALLESRASKREESSEDYTRSGSSCDDEDTMQDSSIPDTSYEQKPDKDDVEATEGKGDLWTPLNCLVEAANRTKSSKSNPQGQLPAKSEPSDALDSICEPYMPENKTDAELPDALQNRVHVPKVKNKEPESSSRGKNKSNLSAVSGTIKRKRYHFGNRNRGGPSVESGDSTQDLALVDILGAKHSRKDSPIWFSLVAAENWKGEPSLPQISSSYLRIKDGKMPVTFIQKYLVKKLELTSEAEVEILCRGQPVHPTLQLHNVVDLWFQTESTTKRVPAKNRRICSLHASLSLLGLLALTNDDDDDNVPNIERGYGVFSWSGFDRPSLNDILWNIEFALQLQLQEGMDAAASGSGTNARKASNDSDVDVMNLSSREMMAIHYSNLSLGSESDFGDDVQPSPSAAAAASNSNNNEGVTDSNSAIFSQIMNPKGR